MGGFSKMAAMAAKSLPLTIDAGWGQGRSAFGGISTSLVVSRLQSLAGLKPLRSIVVSFAGPLRTQEHFDINAHVLWEGKAVTHVRGDAVQHHRPQVCVMGAFGASRPGKISVLPEKKKFDVFPHDAAKLQVSTTIPFFLNQFDIRWTGKGFPGSGQPDRVLSLWARHIDEEANSHPAARLVAMADIPPPVVLAHFKKMQPASSATWALNFFIDPRTVDSEWMYLEYHLAGAADSYTQQFGYMYDIQGRLVCASHQTMVYFE